MNNSEILIPATIDEMKALILKQAEKIKHLTEANKQLHIIINDLKLDIDGFRAAIYGQKSEQMKYYDKKIADRMDDYRNKFGETELSLFPEIDEENKLWNEAIKENLSNANGADSNSSETTTRKRRKNTDHSKYTKIFERLSHLEKKEVHYGNNQTSCEKCFSEDISELRTDINTKLEMQPGKLYLIEEHRHNYVCKNCNCFSQTKKPEKNSAGNLPGPNLLSHILYSRYCLCASYFRIENEMAAYGARIPRSLLSNWTKNLAHRSFKYLYEAIERNVFSGQVLLSDETTFKQKEKNGCKTKYMWAFSAPHTKNKFYTFGTRNSTVPLELMKKYQIVYLITDKYPGYGKIVIELKLIHCYCWAHLRRKFFDLLKIDIRYLDRIKYFVDAIDCILEKDKAIRAGPKSEITGNRLKIIQPAIDELFNSFKRFKEIHKVIPDKLKKAIDYALDDEQKFKNFLLHTDLEPTNNLSERNIRTFAILRKNHMFVNNHTGGETSAIMATIIKSAEAHGLNVLAYLTYIIENIDRIKLSEIDTLLPQNYVRFLANKPKQSIKSNQ